MEFIAPALDWGVTKFLWQGLSGHRVGRPGYKRMTLPSSIEQFEKVSVMLSEQVAMLVSVVDRRYRPRLAEHGDELLMDDGSLHRI